MDAQAAPTSRPFPWHTLDRVPPAAARAPRDFRRMAAKEIDLGALRAALEAIVGAQVDAHVRRAAPVVTAAGLADGVACVLATADAAQVGDGVLIEAEAALAAAVIRQVAAPGTARDLDPRGELPAAAAGAFAAIVASAVRRARPRASEAGGTSPAPARVLAAGPARALEADVARARGNRHLVAASLTVHFDGAAYDARVVAACGGSAGACRAWDGWDGWDRWDGWDGWDARALGVLGSIPLPLQVVACELSSSVAEVANLRAGDVVVPTASRWPLALEGGALIGPVSLFAPASDRGVTAALVAGGHLVLRGERAVLAVGRPETAMNDAGDTTTLLEAIGDVPVTVRVEIGEAVMPAREWAELGPGDVVTVGRRVGETVVLRVGGVAVARGDLVDVDGEVGIRIVDKITKPGGTT